jgi:hypothetical protein
MDLCFLRQIFARGNGAEMRPNNNNPPYLNAKLVKRKL